MAASMSAYQASSSGSSNVTSQAFTIPTGGAVGDIAYAVVVHHTGTLTAPSGWTEVSSQAGALAIVLHLYRKTATLVSGDLGATATWTVATGGSQPLGGGIFTVTGANTTTPEDVAVVGNASTGGAGNASFTLTLTPVTNGCLLVPMGGVQSGSTPSWVTPSQFFFKWQNLFGALPYDQSACFGATQNTAGQISATLDPGISGSQLTAMFLAVRPAGAAGTAPTMVSAAVNGSTLTAQASAALDPNYIPNASAFTVTVAGATRAVNNPVAVSGSTVTLTLASPVTAGQTVTLAYNP